MRLVPSWERPAWQARVLRWAYHHLCRFCTWAMRRMYDLAYWEHRSDAYRRAIRSGRHPDVGTDAWA
jgi:hypothetical protein